MKATLCLELEADAIRRDWRWRWPIVSGGRTFLSKATSAKDAEILIYAGAPFAANSQGSLLFFELKDRWLCGACGGGWALKCAWLCQIPEWR